MQIADKYYLNYLAKFIADNRYYRDNFEKIIDYRDKNNIPIMATLIITVVSSLLLYYHYYWIVIILLFHYYYVDLIFLHYIKKKLLLKLKHTQDACML